jgi:hypothetical protein
VGERATGQVVGKTMKVMCLRSYSHGYSGFLEDGNRYLYFHFPRQGELREVMTFAKEDYADYGHFVGGITKFFPYNFFFKTPVALESCTIEEFDRISRHRSSLGGDCSGF